MFGPLGFLEAAWDGPGVGGAFRLFGMVAEAVADGAGGAVAAGGADETADAPGGRGGGGAPAAEAARLPPADRRRAS